MRSGNTGQPNHALVPRLRRDRDHNLGTRQRRPRRVVMATREEHVMWSLITGVLLLVTGLVPVGAQAQGASHGRGPRDGWGSGLRLGVPLHSLDLTPDQWTQVKSILSSSRSTNRPIIQSLRQAQQPTGRPAPGVAIGGRVSQARAHQRVPEPAPREQRGDDRPGARRAQAGPAHQGGADQEPAEATPRADSAAAHATSP